MVTDLQIQNVISKTDHSPDGDTAWREAAKVREDLKTMAANTRGTLGQLIPDSLLSTTVDVRTTLGDMDALKRTLHRQKAKHHPKNPSSTTDLTIDDTWMMTGGENHKPFLFHDSGSDSRNRLLVFSADTALEHLDRSDIWMMDDPEKCS